MLFAMSVKLGANLATGLHKGLLTYILTTTAGDVKVGLIRTPAVSNFKPVVSANAKEQNAGTRDIWQKFWEHLSNVHSSLKQFIHLW